MFFMCFISFIMLLRAKQHVSLPIRGQRLLHASHDGALALLQHVVDRPRGLLSAAHLEHFEPAP